MKQAIIIILMLLLCAVGASATVTFSDATPANLAQTTDLNMTFNLTLTSDLANVSNMAGYLFLSKIGNDTAVYNKTIVMTNATENSANVAGLGVGFYQWYWVGKDNDGNITGLSRWFEVRDSTNQTYFSWRNDNSFEAMTLNRDNGNLNVSGTFSGESTANIDGILTMGNNIAMGSNNITGLSYLSGFTAFGNIIMASLNLTGADYISVTDLNVGDDLNVAGQLNMTGSNEVIWFANNASITTNATCLHLRSPDGTTVTSVCNA